MSKVILRYLPIVYSMAGMFMAYLMHMETVMEVYPWADHMPAVALLVGAIAALCTSKGYQLIFND